MRIKDDIWMFRNAWLHTHVHKMYLAEQEADKQSDPDKVRSFQLESAANADSVLELLPLVFSADEACVFFPCGVEDAYGRQGKKPLWKIESECYEKLNWRASLKREKFTDTGKRYFRH